MTSPNSIDEKEVIFHPTSVLDDMRKVLPPKVMRVAIERINAIQNGIRLPDSQNRLLTKNLPGITEIRIPHEGAAYRIYHIASIREASYIIEAQRKDSTSGKNIPKGDVTRLLSRQKDVTSHYEANKAVLERRFAQREERRTKLMAKRQEPTLDRTMTARP